jgi:2,3-bisphosphoglycerate-dependent phosphoglycerate mutase
VGKLILVRHGHTPLNSVGKEERLRAWLDVPLDTDGMREAAELAQTLAGLAITAIYSSDLKRARQTAEKIHASTKAALFTTAELRPWNLGIFGGQLLREIIPFLDLLKENPNLSAPNGESFRQFYERYSRRLCELLRIAEDAPGDIVAVTHVRNLLAAGTILVHGEAQQVPVQGGPSTGSLTAIEKVDGLWRMRTLNGRPMPEIPADSHTPEVNRDLWAS